MNKIEKLKICSYHNLLMNWILKNIQNSKLYQINFLKENAFLVIDKEGKYKFIYKIQ